MTEGWLQEAVRECGLPSFEAFPRDLAKDISLALPLTVVPLADLTPRRGREWLLAHGRAPGRLTETDDLKHGFTVAQGGRGVVFLNSADPLDEQRFTLAHEVAHFVLDHLQPLRREQRVVGKEASSTEKRLISMLERIPSSQPNLMERNEEGEPMTGQAMEAELRADRLAFELLAPRAELLPLIQEGRQTALESELISRFGLPVSEAPSYARLLLAGRLARRPFLRSVRDGEEG